MSKRKTQLKTAPQDNIALLRRELIALAVILAVGVVLRWSFLARAAVEHFDEGVYASKFFFGPNGTWPMQHLYAPPLLPAVIENLEIYLGFTTLATMLPSLLLGSGTIVLVWWLGRTWFTPAAGLAAALLVATSEVHALFSRSALTDVPLTFFLLAAIFAWERSLTRRDWRLAILAGLLTGLAGLTKYNGWLPIAIAIGATLLYLGTLRWHRPTPESSNPPPTTRLLGLHLLLLGVVAGAIWAPYLWSLNEHGGYAAVAKNHARYVVGPAGWLDSVSHQAANHRYLEGLPTCLGLGVAWWLYTAFRDQKRSLAAAGQALLLAAAALWIGTLPMLLLAGCYFVAQRLRRPPAIGPLLIAAGWLLLLASTPLYYPYVRLTLPWHSLAWLAAGGALATIPKPTPATIVAEKKPWIWLSAGLVALLVAFSLSPRQWRSPLPWQARTGMQQAAQELASLILAQQLNDARSQPREPTVFVFGEPAILFHMRAAGVDVVQPVQKPAPNMKDPDLPEARVWLVVGPEGERDPAYAAQWPRFEKRWQLADSVDIEISDLMLLDLFDPRRFVWSAPPRQVSVRLYGWCPE